MILSLGFRSYGQSPLEDSLGRSIVKELLSCGAKYKLISSSIDTIKGNPITYEKRLRLEINGKTVNLKSFPYKDSKNIFCCFLGIGIRDSEHPQDTENIKEYQLSKEETIAVLNSLLLETPLKELRFANISLN